MWYQCNTVVFLSTLSLRRATSPNGGQYSVYSISIHALLAESDYTDSVPPASLKTFLSTLSLRRATIIAVGVGVAPAISIHALLAESDGRQKAPTRGTMHISIHALLAESDANRSSLL